MYSLLAAGIPLAATLLLSRLVSNWLWFLFGPTLYTILLWPGVLVHELAHALGALATFTRVRSFSIVPRDMGKARIFGSVSHDRTRNPLKLVVIATFPLLLGTLAIFLLSTEWILLPVASFSGSLRAYPVEYLDFLIGLLGTLREAEVAGLMGLYLVTAIAAHLSPSNQDLKYAALGVFLLAACGIILKLLDGWLGTKAADSLLGLIGSVLQSLSPIFAGTSALILAIALLVGPFVMLKRLFWR